MLKDAWVVICPKQEPKHRCLIPEELRSIAVHRELTESSELLTYLDPLTAYKVASLVNGVVEQGSLYPAPSPHKPTGFQFAAANER